MKTHNTQLWVKNLESIYGQAITAQSVKPFFLAVYDYMDYVLTTDTLAQLSKVFFVHKSTDYEALEQYKNELKMYIESIAPNLQKIIIDTPSIKEQIRHIQGILGGRTQVLGDREGWQSIFSNIENMAYIALKNESTAKEVLPILGIKNYTNEQIIEWDGLEIFKKYSTEKQKVERLQQTRGWYAWQHLQLFYEIFKDYEGMRDDVAKKNNIWDLSNLSQLIEELKGVLKNVATDQMVVFRVENYLPFIQKVHRQLLSEIAIFENVAQELEMQRPTTASTEEVPYIFNEQSATVEINGKTIKFQKGRRKFELLKRLINQPEGIYHAKIAEELEGEKSIEDPKTTYYETCRGIQSSFLKAGITDFIDFDYNKASINPMYKNQVKSQ